MPDSLPQLLQYLPRDIALPNPHAAVIHFPIALLAAAFLFDVVCLFIRRFNWIDRAATALYVLGTLGLGGAYLTGRMAEKSVGTLAAQAEITLAEHEDLALITLIAAAVLALLRFLVSWLARRDRLITFGFFRLLALLAAPCVLFFLALTADHGGALVFRHGVAVGVEAAAED